MGYRWGMGGVFVVYKWGIGVDIFISLISLSDVNVFVYSTRVFNSTD